MRIAPKPVGACAWYLRPFSERERAALDYDDDALVELTALIAFQAMSSKFNAALHVAPQGFCRLRPEGRAMAERAKVC